MPDVATSLERETERITPYQQFVKDLDRYITSCSLDAEILTNEESLTKKENLITTQGLRLFGGMCQLTDDLIRQELTETGWRNLVGIGQFVDQLGAREAAVNNKRTGVVNEVIEELSGEKIEKKTTEAMLEIQEFFEPRIKALQTLPKLNEGEYDPKEITLPKVMLALTVLAVEKQKTVNLLPHGITQAENLRLRKELESHRHYLTKETRPLMKDNKAKAMEAIIIGALILGALGFGTWGYVSFIDKGLGAEAKTIVQNFLSEVTGGRVKTAVESDRPNRKRQYETNIKADLLAGKWPRGDKIYEDLNPENGEYTDWMAFVERCDGGLMCFFHLDKYSTNETFLATAKQDIMTLFKFTSEDDYKKYSQDPVAFRQYLSDNGFRQSFIDLVEMEATADQEGLSPFELWMQDNELKTGWLDKGIRFSRLGSVVIVNEAFLHQPPKPWERDETPGAKNSWKGYGSSLGRKGPWNTKGFS